MNNSKNQTNLSLLDLIENGGVYHNVPGDSPAEIFEQVFTNAKIPTGLSVESLCEELVLRENLITTAVGNGIAIPHPRYPLIKVPGENRILVCFLENPIPMKAPDLRQVYVMFILLSESSKTHIDVLSKLAHLFKKESFRNILSKKPCKEELFEAISLALSDKI